MSIDHQGALNEEREEVRLLQINPNNQQISINSSLTNMQNIQNMPYANSSNVPAVSQTESNQQRSQRVLQIPQRSNNLPVPNVPPMPAASFIIPTKISLLLDYVFLMYCAYQLWSKQQRQINILSIWVGPYTFHAMSVGPCKPYSRKIIILMFFVQIVRYFYFKSKIQQQQIVFLIIYTIQIIPVLIQLLLVLWMFCCICSCACICLCCCFYAAIRQSYDTYVHKARYSKIIEQLCKRNLDQVPERQCPICLQNGSQMANMSCHHAFHPKCLSAWLAAHNTCPICRAKIY